MKRIGYHKHTWVQRIKASQADAHQKKVQKKSEKRQGEREREGAREVRKLWFD